MIQEEVISPIFDKDIQKNKSLSPIWDKAFKRDEITTEIYDKYPEWYIYYIKFDGLKPVQCVKMSKFVL